MAIKLRNVWEARSTIIGLDTIIYDEERSAEELWSTGDGWIVEWKGTHVVVKRDDALVSASDAGKRGRFVGRFQAVD